MSEEQKSPKECYDEFKALWQHRYIAAFNPYDQDSSYQWSSQDYWVELGKLGPDVYQLFLSDPEQAKQRKQLDSGLEFTDLAKDQLSDQWGTGLWNHYSSQQTEDSLSEPVLFEDGVQFKVERGDCRGYIFNQSLRFESTVESNLAPNRKVHFSGATFNGAADFSGVTFNGIAYFSGATFHSEVSFSPVTFKKSAHFSEAKFNSTTNFPHVTFTGNAILRKATFSHGAYFFKAEFKGIADFSETIFDGEANFPLARFNYIANFSKATFDGEANFLEATFNYIARFSNAKFKGASNFDAEFIKEPPKFHEAKLHKDTEILHAQLPKPKGDGSYRRAYRTLKLAFSQMQSIREEQHFGRLEMEEERFILVQPPRSDKDDYFGGREKPLPAQSRWDKIGNCARFALLSFYKYAGDYGFSILRPSSCLLGLWIVVGLVGSFLGYALNADASLWASIDASFRTSLYLTLPPYLLSSDHISSSLSPSGWWLLGWFAFHRALSLILWFLVLLSLRNLTKMR